MTHTSASTSWRTRSKRWAADVEQKDFWYLLGLIAILSLNLRVHSRHLRLHDEMLHAIMHPDLDGELAAMSPPREA